MIDDCTALILAGGDSRRMGQDKAMLMLEGKTLLEHVTVTMQQVFPSVIVSVRQPREGLHQRQVCDEVAASGPLAGLVSGLQQAETSWIFAVACDMPFITPAVVEGLAPFRNSPIPLMRGGIEIHAVVPMVKSYAQPLAAFYARSALATMQACLASDDKSLRGMLKKLEVRYVDGTQLCGFDSQLRSFFDLDTPQDYQAALK